MTTKNKYKKFFKKVVEKTKSGAKVVKKELRDVGEAASIVGKGLSGSGEVIGGAFKTEQVRQKYPQQTYSSPYRTGEIQLYGVKKRKQILRPVKRTTGFEPVTNVTKKHSRTKKPLDFGYGGF